MWRARLKSRISFLVKTKAHEPLLASLLLGLCIWLLLSSARQDPVSILFAGQPQSKQQPEAFPVAPEHLFPSPAYQASRYIPSPAKVDAPVHQCYEHNTRCSVMVSLSPFDFSKIPIITYAQFRRLLPLKPARVSEVDFIEGCRIRHVLDLLKKHSQEHRWPVYDYLCANQIAYRTFHIDNSFVAELTRVELAWILEHHDVHAVHLDAFEASYSSYYTTEMIVASPDVAKMVQQALLQFGAPEAWAMGGGKRITVGTIDTGVSLSATSLLASYRGYNAETKALDHSYNWWTANAAKKPVDCTGHGTAAMSLAVGSPVQNVTMSVAPLAKWIGATCHPQKDLVNGVRKFPERESITTQTLSCYKSAIQWMLEPTDVQGQRPDSMKAPKIIYFPMTFGRHSMALLRAFDVLDLSGRITIVPIGHSSASRPCQKWCQTIFSPADYDTAVTVASTNLDYKYSEFNSAGPSLSSREMFRVIKPDFSAFGEHVYVARAFDQGFEEQHGSSLAAALVTGLAAVLTSNYPYYTQDYIRNAVRAGAIRDSLVKARCDSANCGGRSSVHFPNCFYGYGLASCQGALNVTRLWHQTKVYENYGLDFQGRWDLIPVLVSSHM